MATSDADGNNGCFVIPRHAIDLQLIVSDGLGWEHVSVVPVSRTHKAPLYRCATWEEMCFVKEIFWAADECVVQYHPPRHMYRNARPYCLHLWRPQSGQMPMPDPEMVAPWDSVSMRTKRP